MPINIPITFNSNRINTSFKKLYFPLKVLIYVIWIGLIIYFLYKYSQSGNNFSITFSMALFFGLLMQIYDNWKRSKKQK
jgi:hypothetical protein